MKLQKYESIKLLLAMCDPAILDEIIFKFSYMIGLFDEFDEVEKAYMFKFLSDLRLFRHRLESEIIKEFDL